jgi:Tfp pilus assembly protein PilO
MSDQSIAAHIENLVAEEQELRRREQTDSQDVAQLEADKDRLRSVEIELDRCWDLLRQRRSHAEFGQDPDEARVRDASTVERYLQ